jgi:hypothetical protein
MPYIPNRFLSADQIEQRRLADRDRRWRKRGVPKLRDPTKPLADSTLRTRAYRARQKELRSNRLAAGVSPASPVTLPPVPRVPVEPIDLPPLDPRLIKLKSLSKAILTNHPRTQTPEFLLALTALEAGIWNTDLEPEPLMPAVVDLG